MAYHVDCVRFDYTEISSHQRMVDLFVAVHAQDNMVPMITPPREMMIG